MACPSTGQTRGILNTALLKEAKPELIVVNIARGDLVEDKALIAALRERRVWAAGLDVFEGEPDLDPAARYGVEQADLAGQFQPTIEDRQDGPGD